MNNKIKLNTLGFTKINAQTFFDRLKKAGVKRLIDVRLNNVSQLAGFTKRDDLSYFCEQHGLDYVHIPEMAPTKEILDSFKKMKGSWEDYEKNFNALMKERSIEKLNPQLFKDGCLLCSEAEPHHCHRRLVAEYLDAHWGNLRIHHL